MSRSNAAAALLFRRKGDGSTLNLDFKTMASNADLLANKITFTRASTVATYINSSGYVATASGTNIPRFDYNPTTLAAKGLLIEASAINAVTYSQDLTGSGWFTSNVTPSTSTTVLSPDNSTFTSKLVESATTTTHLMQKATGAVSAQRYTVSLFAKQANRTQLYMTIDGGNVVVKFDLTGATSPISSGGTTAVVSQIAYPNNWYRLVFTYTSAAGGIYLNIYTQNGSGATYIGTTSFLGNATVDACYIWGVQQELGENASSYIPTTTGQVTRAIDTAIIAAGTDFSTWYTGGTSGTFIVCWNANAATATARSTIATSDLPTKHLHLYQTANALTMRLADSGAANTVTTANSMTANTLTKGGFSYTAGAVSTCLNGGTVATGTLSGFSVAPTWLSIGGPSTNGTSITDTTVVLNNSISSIKYFPTVLTAAQLQAKTI